jgi:release factor glutamine methyltransferase
VRVAEALREAAAALGAAGVAAPEADSELLLRHVLDWDRAALLTRGTEFIDDGAARRFSALVSERGRRVPLQYLLGSVEFWRREFKVSPAALIPRPETEVLVEAALRRISGIASPLVVDVGTGTGCIALSLAGDRGDAVVHAVELSREALVLARENANRLGLAERVRFHEGDLLDPVAGLAGRVDLVCSNPPYLDAAELPGLAPEVRDNEPRTALLPPDGDRYSIYRRLAPAAARLLRSGGSLLLEIGLGMERSVREICEGAGLLARETLPDLQSIPRVVVAARER